MKKDQNIGFGVGTGTGAPVVWVIVILEIHVLGGSVELRVAKLTCIAGIPRRLVRRR